MNILATFSSGLGYYTSLILAKAGGTIILACRSHDRCEAAKAQISAEVPLSSIDSMQLDLSSYTSVQNFAAAYIKKHGNVDVLINNAGIMAPPTREVTDDGNELQIATNHLGPFLLTGLLFPYLNQNARIISHSSVIHFLSYYNNFPQENIQSNVSYNPWITYANSKLANLYFTFELNKRLVSNGNPKKILGIAVHPGYTATNLQGKETFRTYMPTHSLTHSLTHFTHSHSPQNHPPTHPPTHSHSPLTHRSLITRSLTYTLTHPLTHSHTHALTHSLTHALVFLSLSSFISPSISLSLSLSLPLCHTLSFFLNLSLSPSLSHSHTLTHTRSLYFSLHPG